MTLRTNLTVDIALLLFIRDKISYITTCTCYVIYLLIYLFVCAPPLLSLYYNTQASQVSSGS